VTQPTPSEQQSTRHGRLPRLASVLLLVYCLGCGLLITLQSAKIIRAQRDTTYPEAATAYMAVLAGRTGQLYHSYSSPPYVVQPFGPLFYAVNAAIARASNWDADITIRRARRLTFACFLLCGFVAFRICRKLEFSNSQSALAGMMLLAQPAFLNWNVTMRPDVPALLAMLLSLLFALREEEWGLRACIFSGFFAGTAFLLKQSALAALAAIAVVFLLKKKYKQTFILVLSAAVPVVIAFGILLWRREPFIEQFTSVGKSIWSIAAAAKWLVGRQFGFWPILAAPIVIGGTGFISAIRGNEKAKMIASFALMNLCAGLATIPQIGGDVNYFLPALAGCSLLLPFAIRVAAKEIAGRPATGVLVVAVLVAGIAVVAVKYSVLRSHAPRTDISFDVLRPFKILSDDPYIAMHGRDPEMLDPFTAHVFELAGHWNPSPVIENIQRGDYDLVVLGRGRGIFSYRGISLFGGPIVNSLNANYEVLCSAGGTLVLRPRSREITATPEMLSSALGLCVPNMVNHAPDLFLDASSR
jgi:Dolichyl-phosphate-mannose-protein mannosyltransferase